MAWEFNVVNGKVDWNKTIDWDIEQNIQYYGFEEIDMWFCKKPTCQAQGIITMTRYIGTIGTLVKKHRTFYCPGCSRVHVTRYTNKRNKGGW